MHQDRVSGRWTQRINSVKVVILFLKSFTKKLSSTLNLIAGGTVCCAFLYQIKWYEMISSCNPAASADDSEGGGKRSRRRSPARTCIVPFSYLSRIPTASHLFADHFQGPQGLKGGGPGEGKVSQFTATRYVQAPWAIQQSAIIGFRQGFP